MLTGIKELYKGKDYTRKATFQITRWCNYNCSYCTQGSHAEYVLKENAYYENLATELRNRLDLIDSQYPMEFEEFELLGGEIGFLDLLPIISNLVGSKTNRINITTNLAGPTKTLIDINRYCKEKNIFFFLVASFHEEFADIDEFFAKVDELKQNNIRTRIEFVLHDENHDVCKDYLEHIEECGISRYKVNLKREQAHNYMNGIKTKPYCTQKSVDFLNSLGLNTYSNTVKTTFEDGHVENFTREYFTNSNDSGTCDFNGLFICKERSRCVKFSEKGLKFACGGMGRRNTV